jgi:hypothetical protein
MGNNREFSALILRARLLFSLGLVTKWRELRLIAFSIMSRLFFPFAAASGYYRCPISMRSI